MVNLTKNSRKISAVVTLKFSRQKSADAVFYALNPETKSLTKSRTLVSIKKYGNSISLLFEAHDLTALRAAMNSYLTWAASTQRLADDVQALKEKNK